jgi:hypothetical protein
MNTEWAIQAEIYRLEKALFFPDSEEQARQLYCRLGLLKMRLCRRKVWPQGLH